MVMKTPCILTGLDLFLVCIYNYSAVLNHSWRTMQSEPKRITEPSLLHIMEQLIALEPIFHHPELGTTREVYENMTTHELLEGSHNE